MPEYTQARAKVTLESMSEAINQNILSQKELVEARHTHIYLYRKLRKVCTAKVGMFIPFHTNDPLIIRRQLVMCCKLKRSNKYDLLQCTYENCIYAPPIT